MDVVLFHSVVFFIISMFTGQILFHRLDNECFSTRSLNLGRGGVTPHKHLSSHLMILNSIGLLENF